MLRVSTTDLNRYDTRTHARTHARVKVEVAVLVPNSLCGLCGRKAATLNEQQSELWSCVKVEVAVLGSPSIIGPYGLCRRKLTLNLLRAQDLCESRGGRPGLPAVPNSPCGF